MAKSDDLCTNLGESGRHSKAFAILELIWCTILLLQTAVTCFRQELKGRWENSRVAVKKQSLKITRPAWEREIAMLKLFSGHENFVRFYGHGTGKKDLVGYIVLELLPIKLEDIADCSETAELGKWDDLIDVFIQIATAMKYIHDKNTIGQKKYVYVDMNPANVMLSKKDQGGYVAKIIDLGSIVHEGEINPFYTIGFAPPEVKGSSSSGSMSRKLDVQSDVYSFGMTLKALLGREKKSRKKEAAEMHKKKGKGKEVTKPLTYSDKKIVGKLVKSSCPNGVLELITSLVCDCIKEWQRQRPEMKDVLARLHNIQEKSKPNSD